MISFWFWHDVVHIVVANVIINQMSNSKTIKMPILTHIPNFVLGHKISTWVKNIKSGKYRLSTRKQQLILAPAGATQVGRFYCAQRLKRFRMVSRIAGLGLSQV